MSLLVVNLMLTALMKPTGGGRERRGRSRRRRGRRSGPMRMNARVVALGAGVFFVSLAIFVQGLLPFLHPESRTTEVTQVVRTDLGELKWMPMPPIIPSSSSSAGRSTSGRAVGTAIRSSSVRSRARRGAGARSARRVSTHSTYRISSRRGGSAGPDPRRAEVQRRVASRPFLGPAHAGPGPIMPRFVGLFEVPSQRVAIVDDDARTEPSSATRSRRRSSTSRKRGRRPSTAAD